MKNKSLAKLTKRDKLYKKLKQLTPTEFTKLFEMHLLLNKSFEKLLCKLSSENESKKKKKRKNCKKPPNQPLDTNHYPNKETLKYILHYPNAATNPYKLLDFINSIWHLNSHCLFKETPINIMEEEKTMFSLSSGGRECNESIIEALKHNTSGFWKLHWVASHKGGHHMLVLKSRNHYNSFQNPKNL
jgi:hypothetical protein